MVMRIATRTNEVITLQRAVEIHARSFKIDDLVARLYWNRAFSSPIEIKDLT